MRFDRFLIMSSNEAELFLKKKRSPMLCIQHSCWVVSRIQSTKYVKMCVLQKGRWFLRNTIGPNKVIGFFFFKGMRPYAAGIIIFLFIKLSRYRTLSTLINKLFLPDRRTHENVSNLQQIRCWIFVSF